MSLLVPDPGLSSESMEILETVHRFAEGEMRPIGRELDHLHDPADVTADGSPFWKLHERYRQLGLDQLEGTDLPAAERALLSARVEEEMGWGDAGLAVSLGVSNFHRFFVPFTGDADLMARYLSPDSTEIGCWAITEPDHGSDSLAFSEEPWRNPEVRANCIARRDGDEYVINGSKAAWVSNGSIATVAALFCTIDGDHGFSGGGVAIVPLDLSGVSRGKPIDKIGQRALPQGEIHFDDVRIPAVNMVVNKDAYTMTVEMILAMANAYMGSAFSGLARAAYEMALDYAKERVQGGSRIIEHASVRARLFKMFTKVEAAQALSRRVHALGQGCPPPVQFSIASKTFCTNVAFEVAGEAVQIFGGNGLTKEYPIEKLLRDARAALIEDGCNEMLSIVGGSKL